MVHARSPINGFVLALTIRLRIIAGGAALGRENRGHTHAMDRTDDKGCAGKGLFSMLTRILN